jgi:hypothetical protein
LAGVIVNVIIIIAARKAICVTSIVARPAKRVTCYNSYQNIVEVPKLVRRVSLVAKRGEINDHFGCIVIIDLVIVLKAVHSVNTVGSKYITQSLCSVVRRIAQIA